MEALSIFKSAKLYPILDFDFCKSQKISLQNLIRYWERFPDCISFFQLRAKSLTFWEYKDLYSNLKLAFPSANIIINDFWEFAIEMNSFGIHLGKEDYVSLSEPQRKFLRNTKSILKGTSSHSINDLQNIEDNLWNYSGFGPIFPTRTKKTTNPILGIETLSEAISIAKFPIVPIGGIDSENFATIFKLGKNTPASISMLADEKSLIKIVDFIRKHPQPV